MRGRLAWGVVVVAAYIGAALFTPPSALPRRPLYDGVIPPAAYNWVDPPPQFAPGNEPPDGASAVIELTDDGSEARNVRTRDTQAQVTLPEGAFRPRQGARTVRVSIEPLDPGSYPAPPPGLLIDGNAYRYEARYRPEGGPARPRLDVDIVLRYPRHATEVLRVAGDGWQRLPTTAIPAGRAVLGGARALGVFVAAGPPQPAAVRPFPWVLLGGLTGAAAVVGAAVGFRARRRLSRVRKAKAAPPPKAGRATPTGTGPPRRGKKRGSSARRKK